MHTHSPPQHDRQVTTDDQRSSFREALMDAEDWLYGDGEAEVASGFRKKLSELRAVGNPIARRSAELVARPKVRRAWVPALVLCACQLCVCVCLCVCVFVCVC